MAPQDLIEVESHSDDAAIVTLRGEHDLSTQPAIAHALDSACLRRNVVVDLSECTFVDSSVITALLRTARRLQVHDGMFELAVPCSARPIRRVLELMSVQVMLPVHDTRAAAVGCIERALRSRQGPRPLPGPGNELSLRATSEVVEPSQTRSDR